MKHKLLSLLVALIATTTLWASNTITYTATEKLSETTDTWRSGLHTNAFNTTISSHTFSNDTGTITFAGEVTTIGSSAFYDCSRLTSVIIPNSVTTIGDDAFHDCAKLTSVTIGNSVTIIGERAFSDCTGLTSVTIGNSVTTIGNYAFDGCSGLASITMPNSVTSIGWNAFSGCTSLPIIDNIRYADTYLIEAVDKSLSTYTIREGTKWIGEGAFRECSGLTSVTIPNSVTTIEDWTFGYCSGLTSVTIPNSVTTIGNYAFYNCSSFTKTNYTGTISDWCKIEFGNIEANPMYYSHNFYINDVEVKDLVIPDGIDTIENYAFYSCSGLSSVTIPNSVKSIGNSTFFGCLGLSSITAPATFFNVSESDFPNYTTHLQVVVVTDGELIEQELLFINRSYRTLKSIDVSATTNTTLADEAFKGCYNLETLLLPSHLEYIPYMAVAGCKNLKNIDIPASVEEIEQSAFEDCRSIQSITFGGAQANSSARMLSNATSQLKKIGNWAFYNAHELQHLEIPEGVEEIGDAAFYGCTYLQDLTLPSSVRTIGDNCFALCSKMKTISVNSTTPPSICARTFYDVNRAIPVYVPDEAVNSYKSDIYWKEFNIVQGGATNLLDQFTDSPVHRFTKIIKDNHLLIFCGDKIYNAAGVEL